MPVESTAVEDASNGKASGSLGAHLRSATREDHDAVDAAFGRMEITSRDGYRHFLIAHARVLPLAERLIAPASMVPGWQGRASALLQDLTALSLKAPSEIDFTLPPGAAARWGALYVVEGSRLGGAMLVRAVPSGLPTAYLGAVHGHGQWRALLQALDNAERDMCWRQNAVAGAKAMFGAYLLAAGLGVAGADSA